MSKKRLIDANALEQVLFKRSEELAEENEQKLSGALRGAICFICQAPTVHAEVVVHCGDCEYKTKAKVNQKGFLICPASGMEITDDDYCSYGERREREAGND